jgi:hypothetical protein
MNIILLYYLTRIYSGDEIYQFDVKSHIEVLLTHFTELVKAIESSINDDNGDARLYNLV